MRRSVAATPDERAAALPGDELVPAPDVVMDRAFTLAASPDVVWPWLVQLGKRRAGWYLPRAIERLIPPSRRALRRIEPRWQQLRIGDVIPDYGGRHETFRVADLVPASRLVYTSRRGRIDVSWAIVLVPTADSATRIRLRLRLAGVRREWLVRTAGELLDLLTVAGLAAGLRERVADR